MKIIYKIFVFAAALAAFASCDLNKTPVFEDSRSFAAFDKTSVTVNEDAGSVSIPVTIASVDPKTVSVSYETVDGTAKAGVNFRLKDASSAISFDGKTRTMQLELEIIDLPGEYTGGLSFTVKLTGAGSLDLGKNASCTVKIADLDHPLSDILGSYSAAGYGLYDGDMVWDVLFEKDDSDESVVWITNITPDSDPIYGNVSSDRSRIYIPLGQTYPYSSYTLMLVANDTAGYYAPEGNMVLVKTDDGFVQVDEEEDRWGFAWLAYKADGSIAGWWDRYAVGITYTKN